MAKKEVSEAAEKVAKAEKAAKSADKKANPNGNFFQRAIKAIKKFFKDLRGEVKKIVWPDAKTVLKSSGVVLLVVLISTLVIFGIDSGLSAIVTALKEWATNLNTEDAANAASTGMMAINQFLPF